MQTFSDKVKDHLPDFLKNIADNAISNEDADLLILGTLTVVSACLPNISGIYAGREVFPNLFLFVTAQASSGKGRLTLCRYIVEYIHKQLREEYENELEIYGRQFFDLYCALKVSYPIRFALSVSQQTEFHTFFEQIQNEYSSVFGFDFVASVRRLGLIAFRLTMIMSALRILENGDFPNVMVCSDDDFFTVKTMVETLLKHTAKVYQMLPENNSPNMQGNKNQLKQQYYNALPSDFDKQTAISIAQSLNIPQKTAERYLKQWCLSGQMNRVKHGWYSKHHNIKSCLIGQLLNYIIVNVR